MTRPRSRTFDTGKPADLRALTGLLKRTDKMPRAEAQKLLEQAQRGERAEVVIPSAYDPIMERNERRARRRQVRNSRRQNRRPKRTKR